MMKNDWIIDVMTDIRELAQNQSMFGLAERLDDAIFVAACEIFGDAGGQGGDGGEPAGILSRKASAD